ncbi:MAG: VOC family protein [Dinoroseobacter sp.]|nr:VOC family protein [Dinoroseobacter sp.]
MGIEYYHVMQRAKDLDATIRFYELLGLTERRRYDSEAGRFTNVFMSPDGSADGNIELTHNWDDDPGLPSDSRHFGHIAFIVDDIYGLCQHLMDNGVTINRPPRDGYMAFVRSPDNISIELLQKGDALPAQEPWASMGNTGHW